MSCQPSSSLVCSGRYPDRAELSAWAGLDTKDVGLEITEAVRERIAIGAAISASCEPCFKFHYDKARKLNVSGEVMREAVRIGEAVKAASAKNILGLADRMLGANEPKAAASSCCGETTKTRPAEAGTKKCC